MRSTAAEHRDDTASGADRESAFDRLAVQILSGSFPTWPWDTSEATSRAFLDFAQRQRLSPLIHHHLRQAGVMDAWPAIIRDGLMQAWRDEAAYQMLRDRDIERLTRACREVGIEPIFFKGIALANTVYPHPQIRPSIDVDLIVRPAELPRVVTILATMDYTLYAPYRGEMHSNEVVCQRTTQNAIIEFDCHSAINNRPLLARLLPYEELRDRAIPAGEFDFLIPCAAHSLIVACIHRIAHHNTDDLLWLSDFVHLAQGMTDADRRDFVEFAARLRVRRVCAASLNAAGETMGRDDLNPLVTLLDPENAGDEPTAVYLRENRNPVGDALIRFRSLDSFSKKIKFAVEMAFPSRTFLQWKYGQAGYRQYARNLWDVFRLISRGIFFRKPARVAADRTPNRRGPSHS